MVRVEDLHAATRLIYEAVLSPERWNAAVAHMVAMTKSDRGHLSVTRPSMPMLSVSTGLDEKHASALQRELETRVPDWMNRIPVGVARRQSSEISDADFRCTYIYNEVVRPERMFYGLILPVARWTDGAVYLTVGRRLGARDYLAEDESAATLLAPHLDSALAIRSRLVSANLHNNSALEVLMRLELGVILLDDHARPVFVNSYAEKLSGACDGLLISHQAVSSLFLDDSHKLRAAISSALEFGAVHKANDLRLYPAARCYLRRRPHRLPLVIRIMPTKGSESFGEIGSLVRVVLIVFDPERSAEISWPMIAETFSLTPREAELAVLLARGADVAQAARHMHIGVETARGYLKSVQSKTQTHHQGELVSLLLRSGLHVLP